MFCTLETKLENLIYYLKVKVWHLLLHPKIYNVATSTKSDSKAQKDKLEKHAENRILNKGHKTEKHCGWPITQLWKMPFTYGDVYKRPAVKLV